MQIKDTILVVDDEQLVLSAIAREIGREFPVILVQTYIEAINLMSASTTWRAIVSDLDLGHEPSGLSLLRVAKERLPTSRRILISGSLTREEAENHIKSGDIDAFIAKPWPANGLIQLLRQILRDTLTAPISS
ncbi:MAG: response regulator [Deltaproteobacteria bacterium]|nr:response regulator [Deltaproteobacteria bacterium]